MRRELSRRSLFLGGSAAGLLLLSGPPAHAARCQNGWRARLRELEQAYNGRIGAYALDTATGASVGYHAEERFPLLSTFKVLAAAAILHRHRHIDPGLLDRRITWTEADLVEYSPQTSQHVVDGLTVAQLCHAAITESDNTAGNLMLAQIGGPAGLTRYLRRIGDPVSRLDRWETELNNWAPDERRDTTTPAAMGRNLHALTVGHVLHSDDQARLVTWLQECVTGFARIRAALPKDWVIGDKTGSSQSGYGAANDIAIATPPSAAPVIFSIYTNRPSPALPYDNAVIASTARILAEALGKL